MLSSVIRSRATFFSSVRILFSGPQASPGPEIFIPRPWERRAQGHHGCPAPSGGEKELHSAVIFKVDRLNVLAGWAFLIGVPQRPDGEMIDYRKTIHREAYDFGAFDDRITALLHSKDGVWRVVKYNIGATDVVWEDWPQKYGAPPQIFH